MHDSHGLDVVRLAAAAYLATYWNFPRKLGNNGAGPGRRVLADGSKLP